MKPVIGIDVSSDKSTAIAYSDYDQVFRDIFEFNHTVSGFEKLEKILLELEQLTEVKPEVILEATSLFCTSNEICTREGLPGYND